MNPWGAACGAKVVTGVVTVVGGVKVCVTGLTGVIGVCVNGVIGVCVSGVCVIGVCVNGVMGVIGVIGVKVACGAAPGATVVIV